MKKIIYLSLLGCISLFTSCEENSNMLQPNDFSDISFINTQTTTKFCTNVIEINKAVSFMDLSRNALSHEWEISDGVCFLNKGYNKDTEDYTPFIKPNAGKKTSETTMFVLFQEPGVKTVRLNNTFKDKVKYKGLSNPDDSNKQFDSYTSKEAIFDSNRNVWVFDTIMQFKVLDKVGADLVVKKGDEVVCTFSKGDVYTSDDVANFKNVDIEVGDELTIEGNAYGEPNTWSWGVNKILQADETKSLKESTQETATAPIVTHFSETFVATNIGKFSMGKIILSRVDPTESGVGAIPSGRAEIVLPLNVNVLKPTSDLILNGFSMEDLNVLSIKSNGTFTDDATAALKNSLNINITNASKNISKSVNIASVELINNNSGFKVTLSDNIYSDDVASISCSSNEVKDIFGRELKPVSYSSNIPYVNTIVGDPDIFSFENTAAWFIQFPTCWSFSSSVVYDKSTSLCFNGTNFTGKETQFQASVKNNPISGPAGLYNIDFYIHKARGCNAPKASVIFAFQSPNGAVTVPINGAESSKWVKCHCELKAPSELIAGKTKLNIKLDGTGVTTDDILYIDAITVSRKTTRP